MIQCIDYADHPTVEEADAAAPSLRDVAPRMKPWTIGDYEDMCAAFPSSDDPSVDDHRRRGRADRGLRYHRRPGDPARGHPEDGLGAGGRPPRGRRRRSAHVLRHHRLCRRHHRPLSRRPRPPADETNCRVRRLIVTTVDRLQANAAGLPTHAVPMTPPVPRVPRRRWACAGTVALALVGTGVVTTARAASPDPSTPETSRPVITAPQPDPSASFRPAPIEWDADALGDGVDEGHLAVPIDYADPLAGTSPCTSPVTAPRVDRIGTLLVNPGGPGFGGQRFRRARRPGLRRAVARRLRHHRLGPAGTGLSTPAIDCIDDYDHSFAGTDITPDDQAERRRDRRPGRGLHRAVRREERRHPPVRRDEQLGARHGLDPQGAREDPISYFGFSYGSELGGERGRRCSPTPCVPPCSTAPSTPTPAGSSARQQSSGFESTLRRSSPSARRPRLRVPQRR